MLGLALLGGCATLGGGPGAEAIVGATVSPRAIANSKAATTPMPVPSPSEVSPVDSDGDDVDAYPIDASRHSTSDRDGDGTPSDTDVAPDDPAFSAWPRAVVSRVTDGDTVDVEGFGRVRLIGIDAPEQGECGYQNAEDLMEWLVRGKEVTLVPGARDDRDTFGRLLRYVDVHGKDAGRGILGTGWAIARYDSRDGYGSHPREADYVAYDAHVPDKSCPAPAAPAPGPASNCDPSYLTVCIPPYPPDLDCGEISFRRFTVLPPDRHGFDADHDGVGCESG